MRASFRRVLSALAIFLLVLCGWPADAGASSLSVAPTRVELTPDARSGSITLDNTGPVATTVQVETFAWTRGNSIEELEPTRGLLAVPAVFNLPAGGRQVIRVAPREPAAADRETTYRLVITEVPIATADTAMGVRFALRLSLPVFITPQGARAEPRWSLRGGRSIEVRNDGTAHLHVRRLVIRDRATGRARAEIEQPSYVLAGAAHRWEIATPAEGAVTVEAATNLGDLTFDLDG